ncbi:uncharacterized protein NDAI_0A08000 [Naumovozyma dairenensis CBS 421]|uniref:Uncharacterized protein n=1 Tax=Naumovozyma dairenensis (strain ATCC 10597 / BCRC 20456 / CBS 421 / NBRC 0211 / NRRL Y-12639) TaxID=1071378 RepID=G0W566_NAUDC|nr:hypothetical protein NDAI_0A08000 [Naumovozyma dairenensis CBS 421]CCD22954.1 hypothetical protein NDAI_0A08000 [Naumovozyma dairenensis CBS 421]
MGLTELLNFNNDCAACSDSCQCSKNCGGSSCGCNANCPCAKDTHEHNCESCGEAHRYKGTSCEQGCSKGGQCPANM